VTYSEEQERFARRSGLVRANVPPRLTREPKDAAESLDLYLQAAIGPQARREGWLFPRAPGEYGGGGFRLDHSIVLEEEADRLDLSLPPFYDTGGTLGAPVSSSGESDEQKQTFLPPIYRGDVRVWQLLSEPGAGIDLAGCTHAGNPEPATST